MNRLPILNFHGLESAIGEYRWSKGEKPYVVSTAQFEQQLSRLGELGFSTLSLKELTKWQQGKESGKRMMITFDDGHVSHFRYAAPLLKKKGLKAIFFIPPGLIEKTEQMSYSEICELHKQGFDIGAHGLNHIALTHLSDADLYHELETSKKCLEDKLGSEVVSFSAPLGFYSNRVSEAARKIGYQFIFTSDFDLNSKTTSNFYLKRLVILNNTSLEDFTRTIEGHLGSKKYIEFFKTKARTFVGPSGYEKLAEFKRFCLQETRSDAKERASV